MQATDGTVSFSIGVKDDSSASIDKIATKVSSLDKLINSINKVEMTINFSQATLSSFKSIEDNIKKMSDGFEALGKDYSKAMLEGAKMARIEMETQGKLQIEKEKQKTQELVGINKAASNAIVNNAIETADKINEANKKIKAPTFDLDANKAIIDLKNSFALQKQALDSGNKELYAAQSEAVEKLLALIPESNKKSILLYRQTAALKLVESKRAMQLEIEAEAEKNKKIVAAVDEGKKIIAAKDAEAARNRESAIKKENDAEVKAYNSLVKSIEEAYAKRNAIALQAFANEMELGKKRIAEAKRVEAEIAKTAEETQKKTWAQAGMMLGSSKSTAPTPTSFSGMPAGLSQNQKVDATGMLLGSIKPSTVTPSANQALPSGLGLVSDLQKKSIADNYKAIEDNNKKWLEGVKQVSTQMEKDELYLRSVRRTSIEMERNDRLKAIKEAADAQAREDRIISRQAALNSTWMGRQGTTSTNQPTPNTIGTTSALNAVSDSLGKVQSALMLVGVAMSGRQVLEYADNWLHFVNAVGIATEKTGGAVQMQEKLFKLAQDNRAPLEAITSIYLRMSRAAETLNITQGETVKMIDVVTKSLAIMGTSPSAVRGGLLQLEQALGGVTVRGQEFKSILDSMPNVMKVVAENYMGAEKAIKLEEAALKGLSQAQISEIESTKVRAMSIAELRNKMYEGKVSSEAFARAIIMGQEEIDATFEKTHKTFSQAFTTIENGFTKWVGQLNQGTEASDKFYRMAQQIADNFNIVVGVIGAATAAVGAYALSFAGIAIAINPVGAAIAVIAGLTAGFALLKDEIKVTGDGLATWGDVFEGITDRLGKSITSWMSKLTDFKDWLDKKFPSVSKAEETGMTGLKFAMQLPSQLAFGSATKEAERRKQNEPIYTSAFTGAVDKSIGLSNTDLAGFGSFGLNATSKLQSNIENVIPSQNKGFDFKSFEQQNAIVNKQRQLENQEIERRIALEGSLTEVLDKADTNNKKQLQLSKELSIYESERVSLLKEGLTKWNEGHPKDKIEDWIDYESQLKNLNADQLAQLDAKAKKYAADKMAATDARTLENASKEALKNAPIKLEQFDVQIKDLQSKLSSQLQTSAIKNPIKIAFEMDETKFEKPAAQFKSLIEKSAKSSGVPANLIASVIQTESHWNPNAVSETGVKGLAQFTKPTGSYYGISPTDRTNVEKNIDAAGRYLADLIKRFGGNLEKAVTAYNGGGDKQYASKVLGLYGKQSTSESPEMIATQTQLNEVLKAKQKLQDAYASQNGALVLQAEKQLDLEIRKVNELDKEYKRTEELSKIQQADLMKREEQAIKIAKIGSKFDYVPEASSQLLAKEKELKSLIANKGAMAQPELSKRSEEVSQRLIDNAKKQAEAEKNILNITNEKITDYDDHVSRRTKAELAFLELQRKGNELAKEANNINKARDQLTSGAYTALSDLQSKNREGLMTQKQSTLTGRLNAVSEVEKLYIKKIGFELSGDDAEQAKRELETYIGDLTLKAKLEFDSEKTQELVSGLTTAANSLRDSFGQVGQNAAGVLTSVGELLSVNQKNTESVANLSKNYGDSLTSLKDSTAPIEEVNSKITTMTTDYYDKKTKLDEDSTQNQIGGLAKVAGTTSKMFSANSSARRAMHAIEMGLTAIEMAMSLKKIGTNVIEAITNQGKGEPYSAFARIAMMTALMAAIAGGIAGVAGTASGVQTPQGEYVGMKATSGTGTVLGSSDKNSESIKNVEKALNDIHSKEYPQLRGINEGMKRLTDSITSFITVFAKLTGSFTDMSFGLKMPAQPSNSASNIPFIGGLFTKTTITQLGQGMIIKSWNALQDSMIEASKVMSFTRYEVKKESMFGSSTKVVEIYGKVTDELTNALNGIFTNTKDVLLKSFKTLDIMPLLEQSIVNFKLPTQKWDWFKSTDKQAYFNNMINASVDRIAEVSKAVLGEFQKLGEGMYETVVRLTIDSVVVSQKFKEIGYNFKSTGLGLISISETLVNLNESSAGAKDGLKNLISSLDDFYKIMFSKGDQFSKNVESLKSQIVNINLKNQESFAGSNATSMMTTAIKDAMVTAVSDPFANLRDALVGVDATALAKQANKIVDTDAKGKTIYRQMTPEELASRAQTLWSPDELKKRSTYSITANDLKSMTESKLEGTQLSATILTKALKEKDNGIYTNLENQLYLANKSLTAVENANTLVKDALTNPSKYMNVVNPTSVQTAAVTTAIEKAMLGVTPELALAFAKLPTPNRIELPTDVNKLTSKMLVDTFETQAKFVDSIGVIVGGLKGQVKSDLITNMDISALNTASAKRFKQYSTTAYGGQTGLASMTSSQLAEINPALLKGLFNIGGGMGTLTNSKNAADADFYTKLYGIVTTNDVQAKKIAKLSEDLAKNVPEYVSNTFKTVDAGTQKTISDNLISILSITDVKERTSKFAEAVGYYTDKLSAEGQTLTDIKDTRTAYNAVQEYYTSTIKSIAESALSKMTSAEETKKRANETSLLLLNSTQDITETLNSISPDLTKSVESWISGLDATTKANYGITDAYSETVDGVTTMYDAVKITTRALKAYDNQISLSSTAVESFRKSVSDWVLGKMTTTVGSPESQFNASKVAFESMLSILNNPNANSATDVANAQSKITGYADSFITNIQKMYGAGDVGANLVQDVVNKVSNLGAVDYQTTMLEKTTQIADNTAKMADKANIDSTSMFDPSKLNLENTNSITTTPTTIDLTSKPAANDSSTNTAETIAELKLSNEQLAQLVVETRALVTVQAEANATVVAQLTDLVSTSQEDTFNNRMRALAG
jgi:tape measure domain-containing protein